MPWIVPLASLAMLLLVGLAAQGFAQQRTTPLKPINSSFSEVYRKIAPTGGGVIMGVVEDQPLAFTGEVQVLLPVAPAPQVCVDVNFVDGRYYAHAAYATSGLGGARALAPQFATNITPVPFTDVAVAATLTDRCDHPSLKFVVVSWSVRPADHPSIVVLVNAEPDMQVSILRPPSTTELPCEPTRDKRAVTVTARCRVPSIQQAVTALTVRRTRFENSSDIDIEVYAR